MRAGGFVTPSKGTYFSQVSFSTLRPYMLFRKKPAHNKLKMVIESAIGKAWGEYDGVMVSAGMLAHRYLVDPGARRLRPYVEAGIGLIYTSFRIDGQGLHWNFNPQAGIGLEYLDTDNLRYFSSLRFHHVSNGGLDDDNKGINSIMLTFGRDI